MIKGKLNMGTLLGRFIEAILLLKVAFCLFSFFFFNSIFFHFWDFEILLLRVWLESTCILCIMSVDVCVCVCVCVCMCVCGCGCVCVCVCVCLCLHLYLCVRVFTCACLIKETCMMCIFIGKRWLPRGGFIGSIEWPHFQILVALGSFLRGPFGAPPRLPLRSAHENFFFKHMRRQGIFCIRRQGSCRHLFWKKNHFSAYYEANKCVGVYIGEKICRRISLPQIFWEEIWVRSFKIYHPQKFDRPPSMISAFATKWGKTPFRRHCFPLNLGLCITNRLWCTVLFEFFMYTGCSDRVSGVFYFILVPLLLGVGDAV